MENILQDKNGNIILKQPNELSEQEKDAAMAAYLIIFAPLAIGLIIPLINVLIGFIYYHINKKNTRFVNFHTYQALITQIFLGILYFYILAWFIILIFAKFKRYELFAVFLVFVILCNIIIWIFCIKACFNAKKGRYYYIPVFGSLSFDKIYGRIAYEKQDNETTFTNKPPKKFTKNKNDFIP